MFERFTRPARTAVESATAHARRATATETRPEHLLQALLDDDECLAVRALADVGAPVADLRRELALRRAQYVDGLDADDADALRSIGIDLDAVVVRLEALGGRPPAARRPRFARASKKALELALREAIALHHHHIGTEHLLLGLARVGDRVVDDTLAACGVGRNALRTAVAEAVRRAG